MQPNSTFALFVTQLLLIVPVVAQPTSVVRHSQMLSLVLHLSGIDLHESSFQPLLLVESWTCEQYCVVESHV